MAEDDQEAIDIAAMVQKTLNLEGLVEAIAGSVKADLVKKTSETIMTTAEWKIKGAVGAEVEKFIAAEVAPMVRDELMKAKGPIVQLAVKMLEGAVLGVAEGLSKQLRENMSNNYKRQELLKALFNM